MDNKKKKKSFSTSAWITAYTVFYMVLTIIACIPRLIVMVGNPAWVAAHISPNFYDIVPLEVFAWGMLITFTGYCGIDRSVFAVKTSFMEMGTADFGNPKKLRKVIYLVFAVFVETLLLDLFFGMDYNLVVSDDLSVLYPGIKIPLTQIGSSLASCFACYVLGNKSIRITQQVDATGGDDTAMPWANEKEQRTVIED
jgi:hypothetical protein